MADDADDVGGSPDRAGRGRRRAAPSWLFRSFLLSALASLAILILLGVVVFVAAALRGQAELPELTQAAFDEAAARWDAERPADYDMELQLTGNQSGTIEVQVRGGRVTRMTRNGVAPRDERTWDYWSIDSLFDIIEQDLERCARPDAERKARGDAELVLRAEFDSATGIPTRYLRTVFGRQQATHWEIATFTPRG